FRPRRTFAKMGFIAEICPPVKTERPPELSDGGVFGAIPNRRMSIGGEDGAVAGDGKIMRRVAGRCGLRSAVVDVSIVEFRLLGVGSGAARPLPNLRRDGRIGLAAEVTEGFLHHWMQRRDVAFASGIHGATRWRGGGSWGLGSTSQRAN